ncbi:hypothetical protein BDN72DRAFT_964860 [Pluteus cervinus]|uniref:Uncharacterized protein n=1 Tax=Pluteus cervinus TaxID=181527 RepID=A0ACD3A983_9AGAR|nr:hypothetical protein BDN72DRAFT_964860 [Pluteus cervinus]
MSSPPYLPPELQDEIFLLAFQKDHKDAKNLILIAKRVFHWLIPHVFRVIRLSKDHPTPIKSSQSAYKQYGHHARHLLIDSTKLEEYLHLFPNVTDLAFWMKGNPAYIPSLLQLSLMRLSVHPGARLLEVLTISNLTHLELTHYFDSTYIKSTPHLPKLTHLCVMDIVPPSAFNFLLEEERCPQLRVVVIWTYEDCEPALYERESPIVDDPRIVRVKSSGGASEWEVGARGGMDLWKFGDKVIALRNASSS